MAKSLKSIMSKINLVDVAVVLVLVAVLMCLMKKMNVVEGLCTVSEEARRARPNRISNMEYICNDIPNQGEPCTNPMTDKNSRGKPWFGKNMCVESQCIPNQRALMGQGYYIDITDKRIEIARICSENVDDDCEGIGSDMYGLSRGACCIEDPNDPGECM